MSENAHEHPDLGPLPEDWRVVRLEDICEKPQYGYTAKAMEVPIGPRMLRITDIQEGRVDWSAVPYCECSQEDVNKYELHPGDIVFARTGSVGKSFLISQLPEKTIFASYLIRVRILRENPEFCYFFMQSPSYWRQISLQTHGAVQPNVNARQLASLLLPLPPLAEQRAIAHVLTSIQRAIEATEQVIAAARELKKALMRHLFTYGPVPVGAQHAVPLRETEIGPIPAHWQVVRLGEVAELKNGINFSREQKGQGILTIDVLNMYTDSLCPNLQNLYRVNIKPSNEYLLCDGDILFVRSSLKQEGVGWCALFKKQIEPITFCGFLIRARLISEDINHSFLVNYFRLPVVRWSLVFSSGKVAITNINQDTLKRTWVPLPPLPEQQRIAEMLAAVDAKIQAEEQRKAALQSLFKSMLHRLMTGQVRVTQIAPEESHAL